MKRLAFFCMILIGVSLTADAAVPQQRRGGAAATAATSATTRSVATSTRSATAARSATSTRSAATPAVSARSATTGRTTVNRGATSTASGTSSSAARSAVVSRAGATQKVIGTGTKVAAATENVIVSEECRQKYMGCMDSFCMLDNDSGGRCICSDRNAELDDILAQIEELDQRSYQMATYGVERIEMGDSADAVIANANAVAQSIIDESNDDENDRTLNLTLWSNPDYLYDTEEDIFADSEFVDPIEGKEGDALYAAAADICSAQVPECANELSMLQLMYQQQIRSDCTAYENSLKQQKNSSAQKLYAAETALRDAALEQYQTANKYDLGQCTVEFKNCMQTTGGCGDDFSGCASVVAFDNTNTRGRGGEADKYEIQGAVTSIEISASTYDILVSKKPLCETVTRQCVAVADQVWDTFLREVAPQVKNAELIAEDNARQNCVANISTCFQQACRDNIDPSDPDGSYDLCLTRPETMLNLCQVPLNACGINTDDPDNSASDASAQIWEFVVARLQAMRANQCAVQFKECLQSEDMCGKDYTQCIGLDTDTIVRMCPYDTLVGCQQVYGETNIRGEDVYDELYDIAQGVLLNIDNNMLTECQNAANEAMIKVCGDTTSCNNLTIDENIGSRSLDYKICEYTNSDSGLDINYSRCRTDVSQILDTELGRVEGSTSTQLGPVTPFAGVIDGTIYWESVEIGEDGRVSSIDNYLDAIGVKNISAAQKEKIESELSVLQSNIDAAINAIEADPRVQYCVTGRTVDGVNTVIDRGGTKGRFPELTKQMRTVDGVNTVIDRGGTKGRFPELTKQMRMIIANAALKVAKDNYYKKYDELNDKMLEDYVTIGERMAEIQGENALDARREIARVACVNFAEMASLPKSPNPPKNAFGKVLSAVALVGAAVAIPITGGASIVAAGATVASAGIGATATTAIIGGAAATVAGIGLAGNAGSGDANGSDASAQRELVGSKQLNQWNYKETITATFEWDTLICHKCTRTQNCSKTKNPLFGNKYCKDWEDPVETCIDTQF